MSSQQILCSVRSRGSSILALGFLAAALLVSPVKAEEAASIGKLQTQDGTLFSRPPKLPLNRADLKWAIYKQNQDVTAGKLYVGLPGATVRSKSGNVDLLFATDINDKSPYPIFEAAIIPRDPGKLDFDFSLERGRIVLTHVGKEGPATVRVQFRDEVWEITLEKPGTRFGMETFGRWAAGARFKPDPNSKEGPLQLTLLLVLKGDVALKTPTNRLAMSAPPGPALYSWLNVHGRDRSAKFLKDLPEWAKVDRESKIVKERLARMEMVRKVIVESGDLATAVQTLLTSKDREIRRRAPIAAGAFDLLGQLVVVLQTSKDLEVWQTAVTAFRHWLGRGPGQDQLLYTLMTKAKGPLPPLPQGEAKIIIQLLHGFNEEDKKEPILYQLLIRYLKHERLGVRGLAAWHLHHLAPHVEIPFNPGAEKEEQEKIYQAWKKAIPPGTIPSLDDKKSDG